MSKRKTQEEYICEVAIINPDIEVIGDYVNSNTPILHKCKIDGYQWSAYPTHVSRGHGCPVCANRVIIVGINDLATVRPDLVDYFENKDDATKHTIGCGCRTDLVCPCCGYKKNMLIHHLVMTGFACPVCSDGVSYPNKFCRAMLSQIKDLYVQYEWQPGWAKPYFYDNYFEYNGNKYILEADGVQHFTDNNFGKSTLDKTQRTDQIKNNLAINNGIIVIRIDCRKSEFNYIKNNIFRSELAMLFDLSNIDWLACERQARTSLLWQVCSIYNASSDKRLKYIAEQCGLCEQTTKKYLQRGANIGICNYHSKTYQLGIIAYHLVDNKVFMFSSVSMCSRELSKLYNIKIESKGIHRTCKNEQESYKGFIFKYKDDDIYEKNA